MTQEPQNTTPQSPDQHLLNLLRHKKPARQKTQTGKLSIGQRVADGVAATMGSWRFIIVQSTFLLCWILANIMGWLLAWDPYPFILLNLLLSFQAAYAAPILMMAQNRQAEIDRQKAAQDYDINLKAELEIEMLHQKIDLLREQEIAKLTALLEQLLQDKKRDS